MTLNSALSNAGSPFLLSDRKLTHRSLTLRLREPDAPPLGGASLATPGAPFNIRPGVSSHRCAAQTVPGSRKRLPSVVMASASEIELIDVLFIEYLWRPKKDLTPVDDLYLSKFPRLKLSPARF